VIGGSRLIAGSLLALGATGCLASKGDIKLLQEEIRATRASAAQADSARRRTSDSLTAALANLAAVQAANAKDAQAAQKKTEDELKALSTKVTNNDLATKDRLKSLDEDLDQVREIARQNARGAALARAQIEQARAATPPATPPDSTASSTAVPAAPATPGPATLLTSGKSLIIQGSCSTARRSFQEVLNQYPNSPDAPEAMYLIAESFISCGEGGSPAKADSVYRLVVEKYPGTDFAATSLYKRAEALRVANNMKEARPLYEKIVCEYPKSTALDRALNRLGNQRPACR
jgi:TolA-binding protein